MKLGLFQYAPVWEDKDKNMQNIKEAITCITEDIDLLIFPELTLTGFSMRSKDYHEDLNGPTSYFFSNLAVEKKAHVMFGMILEEDKKFYNTLIHMNPNGKIQKIYKKIHPFSFSNEHTYYQAGEAPVITEINGEKIGLSICYDLRFAELYRAYAKERVKLIVNIANWPIPRIAHWNTLLKARAIENQCFVAAVNRVGKDNYRLEYNGFSSVYDPMGKEIVAMEDTEQFIFADIDLNYVDEVRNKFPFLEDIKLI